MATSILFKLITLIVLLGAVVLHCDAGPKGWPKPNSKPGSGSIKSGGSNGSVNLPTKQPVSNPKPNTPKPNTPKPNTPKPNTPKPPTGHTTLRFTTSTTVHPLLTKPTRSTSTPIKTTRSTSSRPPTKTKRTTTSSTGHTTESSPTYEPTWPTEEKEEKVEEEEETNAEENKEEKEEENEEEKEEENEEEKEEEKEEERSEENEEEREEEETNEEGNDKPATKIIKSWPKPMPYYIYTIYITQPNVTSKAFRIRKRLLKRKIEFYPLELTLPGDGLAVAIPASRERAFKKIAVRQRWTIVDSEGVMHSYSRAH